MLKYVAIGSVAAMFLLMRETPTDAQPEASLTVINPAFESAINNYKNFCSSCHGEKVEMFVDRQWKHGKTKPELIKSITGGYPDNGMPSWSAALKPKEIEELADFILAGIANNGYLFAQKIAAELALISDLKVTLCEVKINKQNPCK